MLAQLAAQQPGSLDPVHQAVMMHVPYGARTQAGRDERIAWILVGVVANLAVRILLRSENVAVSRHLAICCW